MTDNTTINMTEDEAYMERKLQILKELSEEWMNRKPTPTFYGIDPQLIVLPKRIKVADVSIFGWSNRRYLFIDQKKQETYFQVTSEGNDCERCRLCQEKLRLVGWKTGYKFYHIKGYISLYQKLKGTPADLSVGSLKSFLGLNVVS